MPDRSQTKLTKKILEELPFGGIMPFSRFMELALYCPEFGFYEQKADTVGKGGDFYTSISVGSLFGELLACRFSSWLLGLVENRSATSNLMLIEAGAHDGQLALDILSWMKIHRPPLFQMMKYCIVEPSQKFRERQRVKLGALRDKVQWLEHLPEVGTVNGIIFSNELLDAMPVRRLGWDRDNKGWFEWGVIFERGIFSWARMPGFIEDVHMDVDPQLFAMLPDGYTVEVNKNAEAWWCNAAESLSAGHLVTFDYGYDAATLFRPEAPHGTLRAYHRHRVSNDLLALPGDQDLTAHVNFSAIKRVGEKVGLKTSSYVSQSQFLMQIASEAMRNPESFCEWTPGRARQLHTLTHPEHLGRAFKVLVQKK